MINEIIAESNRVYLRRTLESDLDFVVHTEHHEEQNPYITPWSKEQHRDSLQDEDVFHLIIEAVSTRKKIGYVILRGLKKQEKRIELMRIVIVEKGKGYGRETIQLLKKLVFTVYQAETLWLDVFEHNLRAQHLYQSEGFQQDRIVKDAVQKGNRFVTLIIMSIQRDQYEEMKNEPV